MFRKMKTFAISNPLKMIGKNLLNGFTEASATINNHSAFIDTCPDPKIRTTLKSTSSTSSKPFTQSMCEPDYRWHAFLVWIKFSVSLNLIKNFSSFSTLFAVSSHGACFMDSQINSCVRVREREENTSENMENTFPIFIFAGIYCSWYGNCFYDFAFSEADAQKFLPKSLINMNHFLICAAKPFTAFTWRHQSAICAAASGDIKNLLSSNCTNEKRVFPLRKIRRKLWTVSPSSDGNSKLVSFSDAFHHIFLNNKSFGFQLTFRFIKAFDSISPPSEVCGKKENEKYERNFLPHQKRLRNVSSSRVSRNSYQSFCRFAQRFCFTQPCQELEWKKTKNFKYYVNQITKHEKKIEWKCENAFRIFPKKLENSLDPMICQTIAANEQQHAKLCHVSPRYCSSFCICNEKKATFYRDEASRK